MKKNFLLLSAMMFLLLPTMQAQTIALQESFESGQIPGTWSQEYVAGEQSWQVEELADYAYPSGKIPDYKLDGGGSHRAYLRNTSGQTLGYKTKLVSPPMDLTGVYRPILRFYHAQDKWTADVDTLRVYYRTDPEEDWLLLSNVEDGSTAVFAKAQGKWQSETFELPNFNHKAYQIAFEGSDNLGRGIVLDSIVVRSYPECTRPYDITLSNVANGSATVSWHASWDADQFHIVLTTREAEMDTLGLIEESIIAFDSIMEYNGVFSVTATGLKANTTYYVYLQSICAGQVSEWSQPQSFSMAFRETLPYTETFEMNYTSNSISDMQLESWTWGGNYEPVIDLWITKQYYDIYSRVPDPAVMFNGNYTHSSGRFTTAIPANGLSYLATPELVGEDLKDCQVRFWATMAQRHNRKQANSIIVAVATDASDYTTFVPMDTITIETKDSIEEYTVSLEKYAGDGRFVVFVSYFDKPNQFYIDEVTIEKRPALAKPDYQTYHIVPDTTGIQLTLTAPRADVVSYNVVVGSYIRVKNGEAIVNNKVFESNFTSPKMYIDGLQPWTSNGYYVSVQAVYANGKSEWSEPRQFFTSAKMSLPMHFSFEDSEGYYNIGGVATYQYPNNIMLYSTDIDWPRNTAVTSALPGKDGDKFLYLNMDAGKNSYIVFPMVEDVTKTQINFFLASQNATNKPRCRIELGVMSEPSNLATYEKVAEYRAAEKWARCYGNFIDYKGTGKYIVLRWMEPDGLSYSTNYIDDVTIGELVDCPMASGIEHVATDSSAVITWDKGIATGWNVKISSVEIDDAQLTVENTIIADVFNGYIEGTPSVTITGLKSAYPYYVYVQAVCDGALTEWTSTYKFFTDCKEVESVPYYQYFNGDNEGNIGSGIHPVCWTWGGGNYQYMASSTTYNSDDESDIPGYLYLRTNSASEIGWVAMPELNLPIQDVLLLFDYYSTSTLSATAVYVGVMSDANDFSTFEVVDSVIPVSVSTWHKDIRVNFLNYKGNGKYIAFTCGPLRGSTYVLSYLDKVRVLPLECEAPDLSVDGITSSEMTLHWIGKLSADAEGWQYAVAKRELTEEELSKPEDLDSTVIVTTGITKADSVHIDNLFTQTIYHLYVRALCGDSTWSYISEMTECSKIPAKGRYVEDFESFGKTVPYSLSATATAFTYFKNAKVPECWTVGTFLNTSVGFDANPEESATTSTLRNYYPFVFSNGATTEANYYDKGTALTTYHYSNSGYNGIKLYGYYSSTATSNHSPSWIALPAVDAANDEEFRAIVVKGSFQMATTSTYSLIIGVMDDPTDLSTFTVLDSIGPGLGTGVGKDVPFEVSLENYTGTGRYVAFRTPYGKTTTVYLDDIVIDGTGCKTPEPSLSRMTDKSIRLTAGLRGQTDWMYALTDKPASDEQLTPDGVNPVTKQIVVDNDTIMVLTADTTIRVFAMETLPYATRYKALTGLKASTTYYVAVSAICDPASGMYSQWISLDFTTLCSPVSDLSEDFEDIEKGSGKPVPCWVVGSLSPNATNTYIPYVNNTASYQSYGSQYLYLYSTTTYQGAYAISPILDIDDITKKQLMFYARSATTAAYAKKLKVGVVTDPMDLSTMVIVDTLDIATTPGKYLVSFADYKGDLDGNMGKHIVFLSEFNATNQIGVGKVELQDIPACQIPSKLNVTELDYNSAELTWSGNSDKYRFVMTSEAVADTVLNKGGKIENLLLDTIVTSAKISLSGLKSVTTYYAHVAGICDTDTTDFDFSGKTFMTECPPVMPIPYFADFEGMPSGTSQRPYCWTGNYTLSTSNSYPYVYGTASYAHSGSQSVYLYGTADNTTVLVSPEWDVESLSELQVSFWMRGGAKDKSLYIGIVPDSIVALGESDEMNEWFIPLSSVTTDATYSTHKMFTINFDEWDWEALAEAGLAGNKRFAFMTEKAGSAYFYLDDITVKHIPNCFTPSEITADNNALHTIDLHFTPGQPTDTQWEVAAWDSEKENADTIYQLVDTVDCTITGLPSSIVYNISVRTICGGGEVSEWSMPIKANTLYEVDTIMWVFSGSEASTLVEGSTSYYLHPALTPGSNSATDSYLYKPYRILNTGTVDNGTYVYGQETTFKYNDNEKTDGALRFYTTSTVDTAFVILPKIMNASEKQLSFDVRGGYAYAPDYPAQTTYDYHSQMYYSYTPNVVVGTFDDGAGLESFEPLYEVRLPALKNISDDPIYPDPTNTTDKHGEYALPENNFLFNSITIPFESNLEGKRVVILSTFARKKTSQTSCYAYVDNLAVENKSATAATPQIKSTAVTDTTITLRWDPRGGTAWDVLVYDSTVHFLDTTVIEKNLVKKIENITTTSVEITGLKEKTHYSVYLAEAGKIELGAVSTRIDLRTACTPLAENVVLDFDDDDYFIFMNSSTAYYYPNECWSYGVNTQPLNSTYYTYYPRIRDNTSSYKYSRSGKAALQFYTSSSATYQRAYAVMPLVDLGNLEERELVFWLRDGYEQLSGTNAGKMSVTNAVTYDNSLVIGMVDDPEDFFGTFTPIDTLHYKYGPDVLPSSTLASADPTGEKWWEKKVVALKNGVGKYVAFYKPGYHLGEYIDDISFQVRQTALIPTNLKTVTEAYQAQLSWYPKQAGTGFQVQLSLKNDGTEVLVDTTILASASVVLTGLTPATQYYWRVKQLGTPYGDTEFSGWTDFWTECVPTVGPIVTSFENVAGEVENYRNYTSTLLKNMCWVYDNAGTSTTLGTNYPYNIPSTTTTSYARNGSYGVKLYATSTTYKGYITTPHMEGLDLDTMQLTFWMTPCPHGTSGTYQNQVSTAWAAANAAQVEVGTCTDPNDLSTYVVIDTLKYSRYTVSELKAKASSTIANDYTFQKFTIPLAGAVGPYVFIRAVFDKKPNVGQTSATSSSTVYIDDFSIEPLQVCATPQDLASVGAVDVSTTLTWSEGEDAKNYIIEVANNYLFDDDEIIFIDTVETTSVFVPGLKSGSTFYARLKMTCVENGEGDWGQTLVFRTAEAPLYYEQFTESTQLVDGWIFATGLAKDVFDGKDFSSIATSVPSNTGGWYSANQNEALSGAHYAGRPYSTTAKWWMISPTIMLNENDTAVLSFRLNYVLYNANWSTDKVWRNIWSSPDGGTGYDDQFMVVISDDGGKTWKRENAVVWNNEKTNDIHSDEYFYGIGDYSLNGIKFLGNTVTDDDLIRIDLMKYQGKAVKIGFYVESTKANTANVLHIDNVHVNYATTLTEENNICQYEDYSSSFQDALGNALFNVDGDNISSGIFEKTSYKMSVQSAVHDTIRALRLYVSEAPSVELPSDTVCEGETFSGYEFNPVSKPGLYKKKLKSVVTGCDSISSFYLHVTPRVYANVEDTICQGQTYNFNGKTLNRSGLYQDTLTSFITGCDSVINFVLFVRQPQGTTEQVKLCNGTTYQFGDTVIATSGIYTRMFQTATGCDSIATVNVTVLPVLTDTIYDYFCPGSTYKQNGFDVSAPGLYRQTLTSVDGCDSTLVLILEYYSSDTTHVEYTITTDDLPYQYESLIYGVGTLPGTYVDTILVKGDGCDAVVIHTLHVNLPEGLDNIVGEELHLAPSVISVGENVSVVGKFTSRQMKDMTIDIYDMTGKRVSTLEPSIQPIVIGGFYQAGIYNIRVTAGDNTTYNGRVIVK